MFDFLRKKRNSIPIIIIFFAIIVGLTFFGLSPLEKGNEADTGVVATVDGVPITSAEYNSLYSNQLDYYERAYGGNLTDEVLEGLDLRQKTIDALIERILLLKAADRERVKVSAEEVQREIASMPVFQTGGVFDRQRYFELLQANSVQPADYEQSVKAGLRIKKLEEGLVKDVSVSDEETRALYGKENREASFDYIKIDSRSFLPGVSPADDEVKAYYDSHGDSYMVPTRVKAFYVYVDKDAYEGKIKPGDAELRAYYDEKRDTFREPDRARAAHILIRPDAQLSDRGQAMKEARDKAGKVAGRLARGEDFSVLARELSDDPGSAASGGDLGEFGRGTMVRQFEEAVFSMKAGETSAPVETPYGYHIIRLEEIIKGRELAFKEVRPGIERTLKKEGSEKMAREAMTGLHAIFREGASIDRLKKEAEKRGVRSRLTPAFRFDDPDRELAGEKKLVDAVYIMNAGGVSAILDTPERYYIVRVTEREEEHVAPYEEVRGKALEALRIERAMDMASRAADELLKKASDDGGWKALTAAAAEKGYKTGKTGYASKVQTFRNKGVLPDIEVFVGDREGLFELQKESPVFKEAVPHAGSLYVFRLRDAKEASGKDFEEIKTFLGQRLLEKKQREAFDAYLKGLRGKADIREYRENM